jgi:hypothetical protein
MSVEQKSAAAAAVIAAFWLVNILWVLKKMLAFLIALCRVAHVLRLVVGLKV